jgi:hypothetical protein
MGGIMAILALICPGAAGWAHAQPPEPDLSQQEVAAITQSGTVYLDVQWTGFVQYTTADGLLQWAPKPYMSFAIEPI